MLYYISLKPVDFSTLVPLAPTSTTSLFFSYHFHFKSLSVTSFCRHFPSCLCLFLSLLFMSLPCSVTFLFIPSSPCGHLFRITSFTSLYFVYDLMYPEQSSKPILFPMLSFDLFSSIPSAFSVSHFLCLLRLSFLCLISMSLHHESSSTSSPIATRCLPYPLFRLPFAPSSSTPPFVFFRFLSSCLLSLRLLVLCANVSAKRVG